MRTLGSRVLAALVAALAVVGATDLASYAATGHGVLLGKVNTTARGTAISRTAPGPALTLRTKPGSPPFAVGSTTRVNRLNADRIDGLDSSSLQTRTHVYEDTGSQNRGTTETWVLPVAPATYLVRFAAPLALSAGTPAAPEEVTCGIQSAAAFYGATSGTRAGSNQPFLVGSATVKVAPGAGLQVSCTTQDSTTFSLTDGGTVRIEVTRVDAVTRSTLAGTS